MRTAKISRSAVDVTWAPDKRQREAIRTTNREFYRDYYRARPLLSLRYDYIYRKRLLRAFLEENHIAISGQKVLDLGFGNGALLFSFERDCTLNGLEISSSAVDLARLEACRKGYQNFCFCKHDLHDPLPYEARTFDVVICSHVLEHIENDRVLLAEVHRVLKQNGNLLLFVPIHEETSIDDGCKHVQKYLTATVVHKARQCGFRATRIQEHQFFDRPFKKFAPFARCHFPLDPLREAVQYSACLLAVLTWPNLIDAALMRLGVRATSVFVGLKKSG